MLVLVDEMTKQRSLGYAERAFMGEGIAIYNTSICD
jgi:hypothetical protein